MNKEELNEAIFQLGLLLTDPTCGLIVTTMKNDFWEKFKDFELIESWECMVDEINRVNTVIKLHDELVHRDWGNDDQQDKIEKLEKENKKLRKANESLFKKNLKELE